GGDAAHDDVGAGQQPPDVVGLRDAVHGHDAWPDGLVAPAGADVRFDARQAEGLAGPGEHAGAVGYQVLDAGTRGGGVVEDFDGEAVCGPRGGRSLQALRGRRVGELCCRNRGRHRLLLVVVWRTGVLLTSTTTRPHGTSDRPRLPNRDPPGGTPREGVAVEAT